MNIGLSFKNISTAGILMNAVLIIMKNMAPILEGAKITNIHSHLLDL